MTPDLRPLLVGYLSDTRGFRGSRLAYNRGLVPRVPLEEPAMTTDPVYLASVSSAMIDAMREAQDMVEEGELGAPSPDGGGAPVTPVAPVRPVLPGGARGAVGSINQISFPDLSRIPKLSIDANPPPPPAALGSRMKTPTV